MGRVKPRDVLAYWLDGDDARLFTWFDPFPESGVDVRGRFEETIETAFAHGLRTWTWTTDGRVALLLLLDAFPRHVWPGRKSAYAGDARALALAVATLASKRVARMTPEQRAVLYLPLMHAEDERMADRAVEGYQRLVDEHGERFRPHLQRAVERREVLRRFGRFPHRNPVLGRPDRGPESLWLSTDAPGWVLARRAAAEGPKHQ